MSSASTLKKPIETTLAMLLLVSPTIGYSEGYGVGGYEFLHLRDLSVKEMQKDRLRSATISTRSLLPTVFRRAVSGLISQKTMWVSGYFKGV